MVEVTSSVYISLDSTPSADTPPPGMLALILRPPPDRAPFFPQFLGMQGGEARETANSDGIDPFARGVPGESRTRIIPPRIDPLSVGSEKDLRVTFALTVVVQERRGQGKEREII